MKIFPGGKKKKNLKLCIENLFSQRDAKDCHTQLKHRLITSFGIWRLVPSRLCTSWTQNTDQEEKCSCLWANPSSGMLHYTWAAERWGSPLSFSQTYFPTWKKQLMEQIPSCAHQSTLFMSKEMVCDKDEDSAPVLSQVERGTKGNIIYHLQNNLQPLILHKCF